MYDSRNKDFFYSYLGAIFIYLVTAVFSVGYEHPNEHFRIIEFAMLKMGAPESPGLYDIYATQVQTGFQPFLAFIFLKLFLAVGIHNPFTQMILIRAFMGTLCLVASALGLKVFLPLLKDEILKLPLILLTPLLWCMPFISVRFSAETLSGCLFLMGFALVMLRRNPHGTSYVYKVPWILAGLCFGLSFEVSFLTGTALIMFLLWLLFPGREKTANLLLLLAGILMGIGCGMLATRWLYGEWTFPLMNYLRSLTAFHPLGSTPPWYYWLLEIMMSGGFIVGLVILMSALSFWIRHPKNPVTWITLPYLLACLLLPEILIYTLFPVTFFIPYMIMATGQDFLIVTEKHIGPRFSAISFNAIAVMFVLANSIYISLFTFKAVDPDTHTINFIEEQYDTGDIILLYADQSNPYETVNPPVLTKTFYLPKNLEMYRVSNPENVKAYYSRRDKMILLCVRKAQADRGFFVDPEKFRKIHESLPKVYFEFTGNYWEKDYESLVIYQYNNCKLIY